VKKLIAAIIGLVAFAALSVQANDLTPLLSGAQTVPAQASNTTSTVTATRANNVLFFSSFKLTGAGTSGVFFRVDGSMDNSNWSTNIASWWRAASGTSAIEHYTNFNVGAYPFVRVQVHNTNSAIATNWTLKAFSKREF
jgi:hypothetical protein